MGGPNQTVTAEGDLTSAAGATAEPGLVVVYCGREPRCDVRPLPAGGLVVGRGEGFDDDQLSRQHAELRLCGDAFVVTDLGSRNGTFVDGVAVQGRSESPRARVVRMGNTVGLLVRDAARYRAHPVSVDDDMIVGPALRAALDAVVRAAVDGAPLLVVGESGSGKELAARTFHRAGPRRRGPFVAVNCANIPHGLAERLLFGARRGAYSGADADAEGWLQAADGGVLFLDEIAELDLAVQPKLLRALETGEIFPLGSPAPRRVQVRFCFATHRNLRAAVAAGSFRADLYYRIAHAGATLPPLRERLEEIPWLIGRELGEQHAAAAFVEACLLRPWPGNVRELRSAVRAAADRARAEGAEAVRRRHLAPEAGLAVGEPAGAAPRTPAPEREAIAAAFEAAGGNVAAAARNLGLHRTQLYRLLKRLGIDR